MQEMQLILYTKDESWDEIRMGSCCQPGPEKKRQNKKWQIDTLQSVMLKPDLIREPGEEVAASQKVQNEVELAFSLEGVM